MKLLVTGAGGLVGRHVVALAAAGDGVEMFASGRRRPADLPDKVDFRAADLTDGEAAETLIRDVRPTHVIHGAWETRHSTFWEDPANLDWIVSTARLARTFAETGGRRFVQVGSCTEYDWSDGLCAEGVTADKPATRYGKAKLAAFRAVEAAAHGAFEAVEGRVFFVYGPGENPARFVPTICRGHLQRKVPELGSGRQRRDLLHAEDVARGLLALARAEGLVGTVNVCAGISTSLGDVAVRLAAIAGADETGLGLRPDRPRDPDLIVGTCGRLGATGWSPLVPLDEGLAKTFAWWREREEAN